MMVGSAISVAGISSEIEMISGFDAAGTDGSAGAADLGALSVGPPDAEPHLKALLALGVVPLYLRRRR